MSSINFEIENFVNERYKNLTINLKQLSGGINSQTYYFQDSNKDYVIKYYGHQVDASERISREHSFLEFVSRYNIKSVPEVVQLNYSKSCLILSFIEGNKGKASQQLILEIFTFIKELNRLPIENYQLKAKDAMFSYEDVISDLNNRLIKEDIKINRKSKIKFMPKIASRTSVIRDFYLQNNALFLSPSDVGPQNTIINSKYNFIDFEYAGLDSNIKLALDIITHPDINFSKFQSTIIESKFESVFGFKISEIPEELIQFFKLKWALIKFKRIRKKNSLFNFVQLWFQRIAIYRILSTL